MKTNTQIYIDRYIGIFISVFLNVFVRLAGYLFRINHALDRKFNTIAVCKFKGMGSVIQATPLLQSLRKSFPGIRIVFVSTDANREILNKISCIDHIITLSDRSFLKLISGTVSLLFKLWKYKPGVYIDLEVYSNFSSLITTLSFARNRMGYYRQSSHYRMGIYTHMMYYNIKAPVWQIYLQFARMLHCSCLVEELYTFTAEKPDSNNTNQFMNIAPQTYILVNPNTSDLRTERRWPPERFAGLIKKIRIEFPDLYIFITGSKSEQAYVHKISSLVLPDDKISDISGFSGLDDLLYLIQNTRLFITNDSGPMHLAFALKTRVLALFGACAPEKYGVYNFFHAVYKNVYCSPCVHEFDIPPCRGDNQCMKLINEEEVFAKVKAVIGDSYSEQQRAETIIYQSTAEKGVLGQTTRN